MRIVLDKIPCKLDVEAVLGRLHMETDGELADEVRRLVHIAQPVVRPKAVYQVCPIEKRGSDCVAMGGVKFASEVLRRNLDDADKVFAYVASCGTEIAAVDAGDDPFVAPFCIEILKEQALMAARAALFQDIEKRFAPGPIASMNPGSGPRHVWPIEQQRELFRLLGDVRGSIGVTLTESCLMIPNKTVSGLLFPSKSGFVTCRMCPRKDCPNRKVAFEDDGHGMADQNA